MPLDILFTDSTSNPINDPSLVWFGNITHINTDPIYKSKLMKSNLVGLSAELGVVYGSDSIEIKVSLDVDFRPKPGIIEHGYDDNKIPQYWPSATFPPNTPWLFARPGTNVTTHLAATNLVGDTIPVPKNLFNHIRVKTSSAGITLDHDRFNKRFDDFRVNNTGTMADSIYLSGCTTRKNEFLFTRAPNVINIPIKFYIIGETDDDEINYCKTDSTMQKDCKTKIDAATFKCILEGPDGTYEEGHRALTLVDSMYNKAKYFPSWVSLKDSIIKTVVSGKEIPVIIAGDDKVCNTKPVPKNVFYDPLATISNMQTYVSEANIIFNPYNITVSFDNVVEDTILINYDIWDNNNNKIDSTFKFIEYSEIRKKLDPFESAFVSVFLVRWIVGAYGLGTLGYNVLALNSYSANSRTFAHEIGHAKWGLKHCDDDDTYLNDDLNDKTKHNKAITDYNNFMFSYWDTISQSILRHYQWKKIFTGSYK